MMRFRPLNDAAYAFSMLAEKVQLALIGSRPPSLPISANWTFSVSHYGWVTISGNMLKSAFLNWVGRLSWTWITRTIQTLFASKTRGTDLSHDSRIYAESNFASCWSFVYLTIAVFLYLTTLHSTITLSILEAIDPFPMYGSATDATVSKLNIIGSERNIKHTQEYQTFPLV